MSNHHHRRVCVGGYSSKRTFNIITTIVIIVLAAGLAGMLYYEHVQEEEQSAYLRSLQEEQEAERKVQEEAEAAARLEDAANSSFYQKLSKGYDVNILVVGDSIGFGSGASEENYSWANLVTSYITKTYGSAINLTNVSMSGNASYAGYSRVMMLDDGIDYDLTIICYGQNDSTENFSLYYESIIRTISSKYEKCSIISILESSQRDYTEKMVAIQEICDYYDIPVVDTIEPFQANYDNLVNGSVHPNDDGYAIYAECVEETIDSLVESGEGFPDYDLSPVNSQVASFANFRYIAADEFDRTDDVTFSMTGISISGILGIDYSYQSGDNVTEIYVDGELFEAPTVTFDYDFSQRHILVVSNDCTVKDEIEIVFSSKELADMFQGLMFSWE